jgi:hypothetical protein
MESEARAAQERHELAARMGCVSQIASMADNATRYRLEAMETSARTAERLREIIAECLAEASDPVSVPIQAKGDDAALFDLLGSVGCRMPAGGVR